jgi:hypothetical protein
VKVPAVVVAIAIAIGIIAAVITKPDATHAIIAVVSFTVGAAIGSVVPLRRTPPRP